jgi:hypothetical protein
MRLNHPLLVRLLQLAQLGRRLEPAHQVPLGRQVPQERQALKELEQQGQTKELELLKSIQVSSY